jgi:AAHS family 4-hydroxybenzoate transporter-like MFS transporter
VFYPAPIRSTGVGWALGIGRLGGIGGPLLFGLLLNYVTPTSIFYAAAAPMLIAAFLIAFLDMRYGTRVAASQPALAE